MGYEYPKGHPCEKCPYQFDVEVPSCMMGANPMTCIWRFYERMMRGGKDGCNKESALITKELSENEKSKEKINNCIEMLLEVCERKYGKVYAKRVGEKLNEQNINMGEY